MNGRPLIFCALLLVGLAFSVAACSATPGAGSFPGCLSSANCRFQPVSPGAPCPALAVVGPSLLVPSPGATGVSTAPGQIQIANDDTFSARLTVSLVPPNGTALVLGTATYPSPGPGPQPPVAFLYPMLSPARRYTVSYVDSSGATCPLAVAPGGSFTTQ